MSAPFQFKQFSIQQSKSAFKVGTDGVLLGAWANCNGTETILDIGSGTGLIALMLAQRSNAIIHAVEVDEESTKQANENFKNSPWPDRLTIIRSRIQDFTPPGKYDLIISNPPYFNDSLLPKTENMATARHTTSLPYSCMIDFATSNLAELGRLAIILPTSEAKEFIEEATKNNLYLNKCTKVLPTPFKLAKRYLMEFSLQKPDSEALVEENELIIEEKGRHQYSMDYINLTKQFYLNI